MTSVNIHEAQTHFSKLVARAEAGEEVIIVRAGKAVVRLVAVHQPRAPRVSGRDRGLFTFHRQF